MDFKAIDFQADKPKMYDEIRKKMARVYSDQEEECNKWFGPLSVSAIPLEMSNEELKVFHSKIRLLT